METKNRKGEANHYALTEKFRYGLVGGFFDNIDRIMGIRGLVSISSKQKTGSTCA